MMHGLCISMYQICLDNVLICDLLWYKDKIWEMKIHSNTLRNQSSFFKSFERHKSDQSTNINTIRISKISPLQSCQRKDYPKQLRCLKLTQIKHLEKSKSGQTNQEPYGPCIRESKWMTQPFQYLYDKSDSTITLQ